MGLTVLLKLLNLAVSEGIRELVREGIRYYIKRPEIVEIKQLRYELYKACKNYLDKNNENKYIDINEPLYCFCKEYIKEFNTNSKIKLE